MGQLNQKTNLGQTIKQHVGGLADAEIFKFWRKLVESQAKRNFKIRGNFTSFGDNLKLGGLEPVARLGPCVQMNVTYRDRIEVR